MLKGNRIEFIIKKNRVLELKNFAEIFIHNQGSADVYFGQYKIPPSEKHTITCGGVLLDEDISIQFSSDVELDNEIYVSVVLVKKCN